METTLTEQTTSLFSISSLIFVILYPFHVICNSLVVCCSRLVIYSLIDTLISLIAISYFSTITGHFDFVFKEISCRETSWLTKRHPFRKLAPVSKFFPSTFPDIVNQTTELTQSNPIRAWIEFGSQTKPSDTEFFVSSISGPVEQIKPNRNQTTELNQFYLCEFDWVWLSSIEIQLDWVWDTMPMAED